MAFRPLLLVAVTALLSSGCQVVALQPAYDGESVVFDEALVGNWNNANDQTALAVERGEWKSYRITYTERGAPRSLDGNLTTVGASKFMDVTEMRGADPGPYLLPVHGVFRVAIEGDTLTAAPLDFGWFARAVEQKRAAMPVLAIDDRRNVVIASPTSDLRKWLARAPAEAFAPPMTFSKVK